MGKVHRKARARVDQIAAGDGTVSAVVLLSNVNPHGPGVGADLRSVSYSAADAYVQQHGLDESAWLERTPGGFGLVVALTERSIVAMTTTGSMRKGDIEHAWTVARDGTTLRTAEGASIPGAATRLIHLTFPDGRFVLGSAPLGKLATNEMNDVDQFVDAFGPSAETGGDY